jgi:hypothetical protein
MRWIRWGRQAKQLPCFRVEPPDFTTRDQPLVKIMLGLVQSGREGRGLVVEPAPKVVKQCSHEVTSALNFLIVRWNSNMVNRNVPVDLRVSRNWLSLKCRVSQPSSTALSSDAFVFRGRSATVLTLNNSIRRVSLLSPRALRRPIEDRNKSGNPSEDFLWGASQGVCSPYHSRCHTQLDRFIFGEAISKKAPIIRGRGLVPENRPIAIAQGGSVSAPTSDDPLANVSQDNLIRGWVRHAAR